MLTFVGQSLTNTPPTLAPIADQTVNVGITLVITNTATNSDWPPQTLTFSLLNAPTKATLTILNNTNAVFTWRALVSQADSTNLIAVKVTDSGTPNLSATNGFSIKVNPLAAVPVLSSVAYSRGGLNLMANGPYGPDYTLLTSTNLTTWQTLFTSNSPVLPVGLVDTQATNYLRRFY